MTLRCGRELEGMSNEREDDMRTALRQASAIAEFDGQRSIRRTLGLAHELYNALISLTPADRARRIQLIDAIFGSAVRGSEHR